MATEAMQRAILDACFGRHADGSLDALPRELLVRSGVAREEIEGVVKPRFWLYRRLIRGNVVDVMHNLLERTCKRMNAHAPGEVDAAFDTFLATVAPHTRHLRDVPSEFLTWLVPQWQSGQRFAASGAQHPVPAYMIDFARYENEEFKTGTRVATPPAEAELGDVHPARGLVLHGSAALMTTAYPVHDLAADSDNEPVAPAAQETRYIFYRDQAHRLHVLCVTPFVYAFAKRVLVGESLAVAVQGSVNDVSLATDATAELAKILADWAERGLLLGARA